MEHRLDTHIGSEVPVSVYYGYTHAEAVTDDQPASPSEVVINCVLVANIEKSDLLNELTEACQDRLIEECEEDRTTNAREIYEASCDER